MPSQDKWWLHAQPKGSTPLLPTKPTSILNPPKEDYFEVTPSSNSSFVEKPAPFKSSISWSEAQFGDRMVATIADVAFLGVTLIPALVIILIYAYGKGGGGLDFVIKGLIAELLITIPSYYILSWSIWQRTIGQSFQKLEVVDTASGMAPSVFQSFVRFMIMIAYIPLMLFIFDRFIYNKEEYPIPIWELLSDTATIRDTSSGLLP